MRKPQVYIYSCCRFYFAVTTNQTTNLQSTVTHMHASPRFRTSSGFRRYRMIFLRQSSGRSNSFTLPFGVVWGLHRASFSWRFILDRDFNLASMTLTQCEYALECMVVLTIQSHDMITCTELCNSINGQEVPKHKRILSWSMKQRAVYTLTFLVDGLCLPYHADYHSSMHSRLNCWNQQWCMNWWAAASHCQLTFFCGLFSNSVQKVVQGSSAVHESTFSIDHCQCLQKWCTRWWSCCGNSYTYVADERKAVLILYGTLKVHLP